MGVSAGGSSGGGVRRGRRRSHRSGSISEINITPMVDVMLVLMIIFMVAAPMLISGVPINTPKTDAPALAADPDEPPLSVTLTADGKLMIMNEEIAAADLVPKLTAIVAERKSKKIFVRADGVLPYEQVMVVMGALSAAGFTEIGLVTDPGRPKIDGSEGP